MHNHINWPFVIFFPTILLDAYFALKSILICIKESFAIIISLEWNRANNFFMNLIQHLPFSTMKETQTHSIACVIIDKTSQLLQWKRMMRMCSRERFFECGGCDGEIHWWYQKLPNWVCYKSSVAFLIWLYPHVHQHHVFFYFVLFHHHVPFHMYTVHDLIK